MIFLLSLALAALFLWGCAKPLKQHPIPFYLAAAAISAVVLLIVNLLEDRQKAGRKAVRR